MMLSIFGAVFAIGDALKMFGSARSTIAGVIFFLRDFDFLRLLRLLWLGRLMKKYTCGGASLEWLVAEFMKTKFSAPPHFYISQSLPPKFYIFRLLCSCKTSRFLHLHRVCCCESPCINGCDDVSTLQMVKILELTIVNHIFSHIFSGIMWIQFTFKCCSGAQGRFRAFVRRGNSRATCQW